MIKTITDILNDVYLNTNILKDRVRQILYEIRYFMEHYNELKNKLSEVEKKINEIHIHTIKNAPKKSS